MGSALLNPMLPQQFRLQKVRQETSDTATLVLAPKSSNLPCHFSPGQFSMIYVFGKGEVPISISGDPLNVERLTYTVRSVGQVSKALVSTKKGASLGVRGPFGSSWPLEKAAKKDLLFIAGGLGLAPLRPAIYQALLSRDSFSSLRLVYGARSPEQILFAAEIQSWAKKMDTKITVDLASPEWPGEVGVVTRLISRADFNPTQTMAFVCGPEIMMRFAVGQLRSDGVAGADIYVSMERNMKCALALCGRCQFGPSFICKDGPIFSYEKIGRFFETREL